MNKLKGLFSDLRLCYDDRMPYVEDYTKLSYEETQKLCLGVRKAIKEHINSNEMLFKNIIRQKVEEIESK